MSLRTVCLIAKGKKAEAGKIRDPNPKSENPSFGFGIFALARQKLSGGTTNPL
jgi:hypothetical protein